MKYTFTEKKIELTADLREYAEKKVGKIDRYFDKESEAFISLGAERGRYRVEITIKNNGMFYRANELTGDVFASIDSAVAGIERQIRKNKTRLSKRLRAGALEKDMRAMQYLVEEEAEAEEETFEVIRNKRFTISPMTVEEAILQMNLLEHKFFAFRNADDGNAFSVVYTRVNGGYGLISDEQ